MYNKIDDNINIISCIEYDRTNDGCDTKDKKHIKYIWSDDIPDSNACFWFGDCNQGGH